LAQRGWQQSITAQGSPISGKPKLYCGPDQEVAMADFERGIALSPEEIGERAAAIARSLEGFRRCDAQLVLSFATAHLSSVLVDEGKLSLAPDKVA
jgi:hypothetical protein